MGRKKSHINKNIREATTNNAKKSSANRIPGFILRDDVGSGHAGPLHEVNHLKELQMKYGSDIDLLMTEFGDLGVGVVSHVLECQDGNLERAWTFLTYLADDPDHQGRPVKNEEKDSGQCRYGSPSNQREESTSMKKIQGAWETLPEDCKRIIWSMLPTKDIHRAAATSKEWYQYSKEALSWHSFLSVNRNMSIGSVRSMICSYHQSDKVKFDYRDHKIGSVLWSDPDVFYKMVRLGEDDRWIDLDADSIDINSVMIHGSEAFDLDELACLLKNMRYMRSLTLYNCPKIDDDCMEALLRYRCHFWRTDDEFEVADNSFTWLSMHGTKITQKGLKKLINSYVPLHDLTELDVSRSKCLTGLVPPSNMSLLRTLTAKSCPNLKHVDLKIPSQYFSKLELQSCCNLEEVCIDTSPGGKILHLNVSGCKQLKILSLHCPKLEELHAASCSKLKLRGPYISSLNIPKLEHLNINGCREVDDEGLSLLLRKIPLGLKTLNIGGCINISDVSVKFQAIEGCVLDCYGCSKLKNLSIQTPKPLEKLVVSGCRKLATITISGDKPRALHRDHCESLSDIHR